jgi:sarcosine oxidase/L-pipecolate oxidase
MAGDKEGGEVHGVYDVVVVGAGIMGSCTAYHIAKRGKSVLLLEQFDFLHRRGSSHGESRTIRITYPKDYYTRMMKEAYKLWEEAESEAGYMVYHRTGYLDFGPPDNQSLLSVISSLKKEGIAHQILSHKEVTLCFPTFKLPKDSLTVYTAEGGILRASKAVAMFQALAAKHGSVLRDRAKVLRVWCRWNPCGDKSRFSSWEGLYPGCRCLDSSDCERHIRHGTANQGPAHIHCILGSQ